MIRMLRPRSSLALWLSVLLAVSPVSAQGTGSVTGTVTDDTGGVLPGTSVDVRPDGAESVIDAVTDGVGAYALRGSAGRPG